VIYILQQSSYAYDLYDLYDLPLEANGDDETTYASFFSSTDSTDSTDTTTSTTEYDNGHTPRSNDHINNQNGAKTQIDPSSKESISSIKSNANNHREISKSDNAKNDDTKNNNNNNNNIENTDTRMNIVLLYPDDWRHDTIGAEHPYILTPFLNQLAQEGIRFTQNAVTTSICWMSRATLFMGQYSSRHQSYMLRCPRMSIPENWTHSYVSLLQDAVSMYLML
jgi:hypothetical protein